MSEWRGAVWDVAMLGDDMLVDVALICAVSGYKTVWCDYGSGGGEGGEACGAESDRGGGESDRGGGGEWEGGGPIS